MLVSIVIPCYNSAWAIPNLVRSLEPLISDEIETIFIDDGSTDESFELFGRLLPGAIRVRQANSGVGATRNRGVEIASGEFVQLLDADDTINAGKLEAQVKFAKSSGLDVIYSDWRMIIVRNNFEEREPVVTAEAPTEIIEALLGGWWFPPCAALIRKKAYTAVGGCDVSLNNTCDDFDLWLRLAIGGSKYGYLAGNFANYYRYENVLSLSRRNAPEFFQGEEKIIRKAMDSLSRDGLVTPARARAAARRLHRIARSVYELDVQWYRRILDWIYEVDPTFKPQGGNGYLTATRILGMDRAEKVAAWKRAGAKLIKNL